MGSPSIPQPVQPGQSAQAAIGTAAAGEKESIANQPIDQYGNLVTTEQLGPAEMQTQQALANQAAYQGAAAQQAIQSATDPMAYAQRQMRMQAANQRLGQLYGVDPSAFTYSAPSAFAIPGTSATPSLSDLQKQGAAIASNLSTASVNSKGGNPVLNAPSNPQVPKAYAGSSYLA
jgi:hypothetical protein